MKYFLLLFLFIGCSSVNDEQTTTPVSFTQTDEELTEDDEIHILLDGFQNGLSKELFQLDINDGISSNDETDGC